MAKKYIDAEQLKEEIQANLAAISFNDDYQEGYEACGMSVLKSIESFQQEQPEEDLEKGFSIAWARHPIPKEFIPDLLVKQGLREFIYKTARHFYELGKNSKK